MDSTSDKVVGKAKQVIGNVTDDKGLQAKGKAQEAAGDLKDKVKEAGEKLSDKLDETAEKADKQV